MLDTITKYGGAEQRQVGLFHKEGIGKVVINLARGFKDVTNVYTQHEPPLRNILEKVIKADLRESQFPYVPEFAPVGSTKSWKPKEIIVFIVGGAGRGPGHLCGLSHSTRQNSFPRNFRPPLTSVVMYPRSCHLGLYGPTWTGVQ